MKIISDRSRVNYSELLKRPANSNPELRSRVQEIIEMVKADGDKALRLLTRKFDGIDIYCLEIGEQAIIDSQNLVDEKLKNSIRQAAKNIEQFHLAQKAKSVEVETMPGVNCKLIFRPLKRVGLYVPGGTAPLISTVLMLGIPAKIAECNEIVVCTPPPVNPVILYACGLIGARVFAVGGAQAIAALALGTESIPKVDKILGPGNSYVTEAKMQLASLGVPFDIPAGPSELLVIADETGIPSFIAADLLSQAEHGTDSQVVLISTSQKIISETIDEVNRMINPLPRKQIAMDALANSWAIRVDSIDRAIEISNLYAPEHLILAVNNAEKYINSVENAGSVFIGNYSPESAGDYASGTNHTLPTSGFARNWSGVTLCSFLKTITVQEINEEGIVNLGETIVAMASAEKLDAHAAAVKVRLNYLKGLGL